MSSSEPDGCRGQGRDRKGLRLASRGRTWEARTPSGALGSEEQGTTPPEGHTLRSGWMRPRGLPATGPRCGETGSREVAGGRPPAPHCRTHTTPGPVPWGAGPAPYPQLLGDLLPVQVAVLGRDGLQLVHLLPRPLLLVDAGVLPVLPELAELLRAAAAFKLHPAHRSLGPAAGTRGAALRPGVGTPAAAPTTPTGAAPSAAPAPPPPPPSRGCCAGVTAGLVTAEHAPTYVDVGNLLPVVVVQSAAQQDVLLELAAEARARLRRPPSGLTAPPPASPPACPAHLMSWISFSASRTCFSKACFSASLVTRLRFWCRYSSLRAGQRCRGDLGGPLHGC